MRAQSSPFPSALSAGAVLFPVGTLASPGLPCMRPFFVARSPQSATPLTVRTGDSQLQPVGQLPAVHRLSRASGHPRRAARDGSPSPERPSGRRHRRKGEPRHRPTAFEPEILPDGQRHRRGRRYSRLRDALGLRAGLPHVQGVADAVESQEADMVHSQGTLTLTKGVKTAGPDLSLPSFLSN